MPQLEVPVADGQAGSKHHDADHGLSVDSGLESGPDSVLDSGPDSVLDSSDSSGGPPVTAPKANSDWIDAALVAEAVGARPSEVRDIVVKAAVADGDNYCSCMWRVRAVAADKPVSLIVKEPPKGEMMQDFVEKLGLFTREARMLTETLPAMQALAAARCGADHVLARPLGPRALPCPVPGVLVMEDLSLDGFRNKERQGQLDMEHCKMALEVLARYHALSVALHRQDPASMDKYPENMYVVDGDDDHMEGARLHSEMQLNRFATAVETWEKTKGKGYGERMRRLSKVMYSKMCAVVAPSETGINVLNHGDFWINNMMFLYEGEETVNPQDIRLVDLQLVRYASPALDLQYFVTTSAQEQVRVEELDTVLRHYYHHFNEYVTMLGEGDSCWPTYEALREEYLSKSLFGFTAAYFILCAVVANPEDRLQLDSLTKANKEEVDFASRAWQGSIYQRLIPKVLENLDSLGVFD